MVGRPDGSGAGRTGGGRGVGRFLLVSGDFVTTGGMDRANHALATFLAARGDQVELVAHRAAGDLTERPGVVLHRVPRPMGSHLLGGMLLARAGRRRAAAVARGGGRVVVNGGNCDWGDLNWVHYVHAEWEPRQDGSPARRLKAALAHWSERAAERAALGTARGVIANSERTRAALIGKLRLAPERVHTIYYGTDPARFRPATAGERAAARARLGWDDERPTVAFVGALGDLRKGFDTLFAAWRALAADPGWDARLAVVGAGRSLPAWRERAGAEGARMTGSVEFLGFRSDVPEVLRACDGLVSPTRYEAYGLNAQEALCCGLPAVVSATAGVAERYPPAMADLLLPDPEDAAALTARLRQWREASGRPRPELESFSEALREYTWDHMAGRIADLIEATA